MSHPRLSRPAIRERFFGLPGWAQVAFVFAVSRLLMLPVFIAAWRHPELPPMVRAWQSEPALLAPGEVRPGFLEFLARANDAGWYGLIAEHGYPDELPRDASGDVEQNAWAFFPLFPLVARVLMAMTGLPWDVVGVGLSLGLGLIALVLLRRLVAEVAPDVVRDRPALPMLVVSAMCFFPSAGVFSVPYTESLALTLIVALLTLLVRRRYGAMVPLIVLLAFTRAVVLPVAVVVAWHLISRRRRGDLPSVGDWVVGFLAMAVAAISSFLWPWVCSLVTDTENSYFLTQSAWRQGRPSNIPFAGWFGAVETTSGGVLLALFLVVGVLLVVHPSSRRLGPELQAWTGAYLAYLVAVTVLWTSVARFALLSIGVPAVLAGWVRSARSGVAVLTLLATLQALWIYAAWSTGAWIP